MIKKFEDFILENKNYKSNHIFPDEYCKLDKTFTDFSLKNIPLKFLKKQFKNFKVYLIPLSFDNELKDINENINRSVDIEKVRYSIMNKYPLMDWQFEIKEERNKIKIAIVIPNVDDNIRMIIDDMFKLGYFESFRNEMSEQGFPYTLIRFEPRFPNDITNQVRNMGVIYHLSPKYNLKSIMEHGFIPQCKNTQYKFPPRIYFFKSKTNDDEFEKLGRTLYKFDDNPHKNGEYILYILSVDKIPNNVEFVGDCNYEQGVCTENKIPYDAVISTQEFKF